MTLKRSERNKAESDHESDNETEMEISASKKPDLNSKEYKDGCKKRSKMMRNRGNKYNNV